jgi:hypothetical protein
MKPSPFNRTLEQPIAIQPASAGLPDRSWWADPAVSWDEFTDRAKDAAVRMKESRLGRVNVLATD